MIMHINLSFIDHSREEIHTFVGWMPCVAMLKLVDTVVLFLIFSKGSLPDAHRSYYYSMRSLQKEKAYCSQSVRRKERCNPSSASQTRLVTGIYRRGKGHRCLFVDGERSFRHPLHRHKWPACLSKVPHFCSWESCVLHGRF
jgi:hypothetical protein